MSGLKINFAKNRFGSIGMWKSCKQTAANYLNCSLLPIPFVYLGMPIGANPRRCQLWDPIINKCERKLTKWNQRHIFWGESHSYKVNPNLYSNLFLLFFQGTYKGGGQIGVHTT